MMMLFPSSSLPPLPKIPHPHLLCKLRAEQIYPQVDMDLSKNLVISLTFIGSQYSIS